MTKRLFAAAALFVASSMLGTTAQAARGASQSPPFGADYFPNVPVVTQDGKTLMFRDDLLKDKRVLINFIFTKCQASCPLDTAKMAQVQKLFGSRVGKDIHMYSITLDPENDTPEVLKAYAEQFGAKPGWLFLTGKREDIDKIRYKLGDRDAMEEHANSVKAGDMANGHWIKLPLASNAGYIVAEVNDTFFPEWSAGKKLANISDAPRQEVFGPGELMFQARCAVCHSVGKGDGLGPDLQGLTVRRTRAWVTRYLGEPEKMRAEKDPIAVELANKYKVLMPNLSLTNQELDDLVAYLAAKTGPASGAPKAAPAPAPAAASEAQADAHHDHSHDHHTAE